MHWRIGNASCSAATAFSASLREPNGPRYVASSRRTSLTSDTRGNGSTVSLTQVTRSGNRERRLYRGLVAAMRRSSRTSASSGVVHSIALTWVARPTISPMRERVSDAVKYVRTRVRRSLDLPTYSVRPRSSLKM